MFLSCRRTKKKSAVKHHSVRIQKQTERPMWLLSGAEDYPGFQVTLVIPPSHHLEEAELKRFIRTLKN